MTIGKEIAKLRLANNMTQEALAEKLGVSRQAVTKWEASASVPDLAKAIQIADLFQVSLDRLVGRSDTMYDVLKDRIEDLASATPPKDDADFIHSAYRFIKYMENMGTSHETIIDGLLFMCREDDC